MGHSMLRPYGQRIFADAQRSVTNSSLRLSRILR